MEPYRVRLRIRQWNGKPAFAERRLWLAERRDGAPSILFKGDEPQEVFVDSEALEYHIERACRGGGFEKAPEPEPVTTQEEEDDPLA